MVFFQILIYQNVSKFNLFNKLKYLLTYLTKQVFYHFNLKVIVSYPIVTDAFHFNINIKISPKKLSLTCQFQTIQRSLYHLGLAL